VIGRGVIEIEELLSTATPRLWDLTVKARKVQTDCFGLNNPFTGGGALRVRSFSQTHVIVRRTKMNHRILTIVLVGVRENQIMEALDLGLDREHSGDQIMRRGHATPNLRMRSG
jgi:hypothetical protein